MEARRPPNLPPDNMETGCAPDTRVAWMATEGLGEGKRKGGETPCHVIRQTDICPFLNQHGSHFRLSITSFGPPSRMQMRKGHVTQRQHLSRPTSPPDLRHHPAPQQPLPLSK